MVEVRVKVGALGLDGEYGRINEGYGGFKTGPSTLINIVND